jgi:hypothetical protein
MTTVGIMKGAMKKQLYLLVNGHKDLYPFIQGEEKLVEIAAVKESLKEKLGTKFIN